MKGGLEGVWIERQRTKKIESNESGNEKAGMLGEEAEKQ